MIIERSDGNYILAQICGRGCPCRFSKYYTHLNMLKNPMKKDSEVPERRYINVRGREEHEAIIGDEKLCEELGLDRIYECIVYLKRWGKWLCEENHS